MLVTLPISILTSAPPGFAACTARFVVAVFVATGSLGTCITDFNVINVFVFGGSKRSGVGPTNFKYP